MKQLKPRDKITQKMTRDGAVEINETQQTAERISSREADSDFSQPDTATAERVMEHLDAAHTRKASKKAVKKAQEAAVLRTSTSRLQFTDEERETPKLQPYIKKSEKAADKLDAAKAALPKQKKLVKERTFEETTGKAKTRLRFEEQEKPIPGGKAHSNPLSHPAQEAGIFVHNKIHSVEKDNSGVEGAHKSEKLAERGARYGTRKLKQGYRSHKLKPYREAAKAEQAAFKANVNFQYHKALQENPQLTSNPFSRFMQKQKIKRQYAKTVKKSGAATAKAAAGASQTAAKKAAAFAGRHPAGVIIAIAALLLFIMVSVGLSSCGAMFSGSMNSVLGTSYTSEDSDLVATEQSYAAMENELQQEIDNIESTHSGYDEYRYDLDTIGHDDKELCALMKKCIEQEKLSAVTVYNGIEGVRLIDENKDSYSLIILDVMLPDIDGFQILQKIRDTSNIPVLMLTAKSSEEDKVFGLRLGADDYLTKPFGINELLARVNSLIRRYTTLNPFTADIDSISLKDMVIDKLNRTVTVKDIPVLLTGKEFDLLLFLASNKGRVFTKKQIYSQVWEEEYAFDDSNIMSFISKLRKKIEPDPDHPFYILTVRGVGYRFNKEA